MSLLTPTFILLLYFLEDLNINHLPTIEPFLASLGWVETGAQIIFRSTAICTGKEENASVRKHSGAACSVKGTVQFPTDLLAGCGADSG